MDSLPTKKAVALDPDGNALPSSTRARDGRAWHPRESQVAALDYCQDHDYEFQKKDVCEAVGIAPRTFRAWFDTPAFVSWWNEQLEKYMAEQLPRICAALIKEATHRAPKGRSAAVAAKLFFQRFDKHYIPASKHDLNVKGELKVGVGNEKLDLILDEVIARCAEITGGQCEVEENSEQSDSGRTSLMD